MNRYDLMDRLRDAPDWFRQTWEERRSLSIAVIVLISLVMVLGISRLIFGGGGTAQRRVVNDNPGSSDITSDGLTEAHANGVQKPSADEGVGWEMFSYEGIEVTDPADSNSRFWVAVHVPVQNREDAPAAMIFHRQKRGSSEIRPVLFSWEPYTLTIDGVKREVDLNQPTIADLKKIAGARSEVALEVGSERMVFDVTDRGDIRTLLERAGL